MPPPLIALTGPLGAGKTCFVQGIADGLGLDRKEVVSPTYTLLNLYGDGPVLAHLDLYRVESLEAAWALGLQSAILERTCITAVEWAERFPTLFDSSTVWVRFTALGNARQIEIEMPHG